MEYGKRRLRVGDAFEASSRDARVLVLIGKAKYAEPEIEESAPVIEPEMTSRRRYRRRDLQAQA